MTFKSDAYEKRIQIFTEEVSLYPVSCETLAAGRNDREWLDAVLMGGAKVVQLRDKESSDSLLLEKAVCFRERTREAGALFIVNDRLDIALLADADGIHVGQKDLPPAAIRSLAPDLLIGVSCNSEDDVRLLEESRDKNPNLISYFNIGPIYPTATKKDMNLFLGIEAIGRLSAHCPLPFTVMGGIKYDHIPELKIKGVRRVAVVTALTQAADIRKETILWIEALRSTDARTM